MKNAVVAAAAVADVAVADVEVDVVSGFAVLDK